ncbi:MAG: tetratricopeptide repeat protein, partial [Candidatus Sericytochromatia bacterium]
MNPPSPVNTELELARALLGREPMNPRAWLGLGRVLEQQYRHAEALKVYREGMARLPCEAGLKQAAGILLMHGGKLWQALPLLESALAVSSEPAPELLEALAGVLLELGQTERAHQLLSAGDGDRGLTRVLLALAEQQLGRPEQAIGHYQRALELTEPGSSQAARICHNLGNLYCLAGELPAAEAAFAQALEHSPGLARTQLQLDLLQ